LGLCGDAVGVGVHGHGVGGVPLLVPSTESKNVLHSGEVFERCYACAGAGKVRQHRDMQVVFNFC
jgi:hypothetical protein